MRTKHLNSKKSAEQVVKDIRRATRKQYSAEEKIRIVLDGLRGEDTLKTILPDIERLTGANLDRILADAGYKGHNACLKHKFKVFTAGQKRRVTPAIKRQMKRRAAVEPVIGHLKSGHRMNRNYLSHNQGDAINPILAAAGYNFRLILKWIRALWLQICWALIFNQSAKIG